MAEGLRVKKAAKIKIQILESAKRQLGNKPYSELHVNQICYDIGYSKVTFFKYFPHKDDVLLYYWRVWCLERSIELYNDPKEGLAGVEFLFDKIAQSYDKAPGFLLGYISYVTSLKRPPSPFTLRPIERRLLMPQEENIGNIELHSIPQMLDKFLLEAIFKKQIEGLSDTKILTNMFLTVLYGSVVTAHMRQESSLRLLLRNNMENTLKQIGAMA